MFMCKVKSLFFFFTFIVLFVVIPAPGLMGQTEQEKDSVIFITDSLKNIQTIDLIAQISARKIKFETKQAVEYLSALYNSDNWNDENDPLRLSIKRLLFEATNDPLYNTEELLREYNWEKIRIPAGSFFMWDTIHIPVPSGKADRREEFDKSMVDPLFTDTLNILKDTIRSANERYSDTLDTDSINMSDPGALNNIFVLDNDQYRRSDSIQHDSIIIVISDTLREVISSNPDFPFRYYDYPMVGDSIQAAVNKLLEYVSISDSSRIFIKGSENSVPVWLKEDDLRMTRLWLRNEWNEEVSVWIGSISRDSVEIVVERGVHFIRPNKTTNIADAKIEVKTVDNSQLAEAKKIDYKPQYWKYLSEASFVFNQATIKNWSKGGESNISTLLDITGTANYTNKEKKMVWDNQGRIKFGLITSAENGIRKNTDQIDIVSKFTNKAFGKFDFSATMLFKTQLANGYNYPNDSVVISKFFNPADITVGLGLDYKPNKNLSINFAPLSYKATFVPDTAHIDQTKHGLKADQRSKHEPGLSAQISHKVTVFKEINIENKVRLFTNYINNPLNIDIDWEMIATAKLNWFTDIRLNTHLIYDDDTLIPVKDDDGEVVLNTDGTPKKVPMVQFKELIGLSIIFRF